MMSRFWMVWVVFALGACLDPGEPGNLVPKTVVEDPSLPRITVAGTILHAETFGDPAAPGVMVVHGGPGGDYRGLLPLKALADDGYRVVFWDQRGSGLSQRHDRGIYTYELYLEDLRLVIEETIAPGQPFVFIGHSWGAMYSTWFINEYGDYDGRIRGAILSEPGGFTKRQLDEFLEKFTGAFELTGETLNDALWLRQFISDNDHERADYLRSIMAGRGVPSEGNDPDNPSPRWRPGAVAYDAMFSLANNDPFDWTTNLARFQRRVLFLRGDRNTAATAEHQAKVAASYPSAEIVTIKDAGHEMIWERPDEYLAHTREYFRTIDFEGGTQ